MLSHAQIPVHKNIYYLAYRKPFLHGKNLNGNVLCTQNYLLFSFKKLFTFCRKPLMEIHGASSSLLVVINRFEFFHQLSPSLALFNELFFIHMPWRIWCSAHMSVRNIAQWESKLKEIIRFKQKEAETRLFIGGWREVILKSRLQ